MRRATRDHPLGPTRRGLLQLAAGLPLAWSGCGVGDDPVALRAEAVAAFEGGAAWLVAHQSDDGSVRDEDAGYATGQFLTPLCAVALTEMIGVQGLIYHGLAVGRMIDFLLSKRARNGAIGFAEAEPVQPVTCTSRTIRALARARPGLWGDHAAVLLWWLRRQQIPADGQPRSGPAGGPAFADDQSGGFTRGWWRAPSPEDRPRVSLVYTREAVQALDALGVHGDDPAMRAARAFAARCRGSAGDVGDEPGAAPSVSAAAHGAVVALCGGGAPEEVRPWVEALTDRLAEAPFDLQIVADHAALLERVGDPTRWQDSLIARILEARQDDGSWSGGIADNPTIATASAITALACALRSWPRGSVRRR